MSVKRKNDLAWEEILEEVTAIEREVANKGFYDIGSDQIKKYGNREPRLACKIDYRQSMPTPLKERGLSVLAVRNARYKIARTDPFISIDQAQFKRLETPDTFIVPPHIKAISPQNISSESKALDAALVSGMLEAVIGESVGLVLRGREFCQPIKFSLPDSRDGSKLMAYRVEKVQLEVDGGYEGKGGIHLIEAKLGLKDNINLRQLLYPQLHYEKLFRKPVMTYVLFYEQGTGYFHFLRFRKGEPYHLSDYRCCALETNSSNFCWDDLHAVKNVDMTDKMVPFPQANSFEKVFTAFLRLDQIGPLTKEELFVGEDIDPRQYDYYANVLRWMRLVKKNRDDDGVIYLLTELGVNLAKKPVRRILFEMAKIIFSNELCRLFIDDKTPKISEEIARRNGLNKDKTTFGRRIQTIRRWRKYFQVAFTA